MGIIKGCAKIVGSVVLGATGVASTVLKGVSDTVGLELGSELFGASFNGIRNMWDGEGAQEAIDSAEEISFGMEDANRRKMAETAYRAAQIAREKGDEEKYQWYMEKYYEYK